VVFELGTITLKEVVAGAGFVFMVGGAWRDIRAMKKTQRRHSQYLSNDHDVLIEISTEHNRNHGANIRIPKMTLNGNGADP
jgi:hypothetical protein